MLIFGARRRVVEDDVHVIYEFIRAKDAALVDERDAYAVEIQFIASFIL